MAEEWWLGIPPPLLFIGGFFGILLLLALLSGILEKFIELVARSINTTFGGRPGGAPERKKARTAYTEGWVSSLIVILAILVWISTLWFFSWTTWVVVGVILILTSVIFAWLIKWLRARYSSSQRTSISKDIPKNVERNNIQTYSRQDPSEPSIARGDSREPLGRRSISTKFANNSFNRMLFVLGLILSFIGVLLSIYTIEIDVDTPWYWGDKTYYVHGHEQIQPYLLFGVLLTAVALSMIAFAIVMIARSGKPSRSLLIDS